MSKWVWGIGGMVLIGKIVVVRERSVPVPFPEMLMLSMYLLYDVWDFHTVRDLYYGVLYYNSIL